MSGDGLLINSNGATLRSDKAARSMLGALSRGMTPIGDMFSDLTREYDEGQGLTVEVYDKVIAVLNLHTFRCGLWMEDQLDICVQIYPLHTRMNLLPPSASLEALVGEKANAIGAQFFDGVCPVMADWYDSRHGHRRRALESRDRVGMDLLEFRMVGLYLKPSYEDRVAQFLIALDRAWLHALQDLEATRQDGLDIPF